MYIRITDFHIKDSGLGATFTDFDNDHDLDLLVNHDFGYKATPNFFLENQIS